MTTRIAKDEMALLMPNALGHYFKDESTDAPAAEELGLFARAIAGLRSYFARQAVLAELGALSDHELADIGVTRADLPRVCDEAFAAQRAAEAKLGNNVFA